ncbi:MAG: hypothetical protein JST94_11300 [Bacteroidetes bacterium]|nr:hypothetical protein [Bacteroidota bacterium]MBS1672012.1 hypothetical protein [Bacteroidota bacterium]
MKPILILTMLCIASVSLTAQTKCTELENLMNKMDSVDKVLQQHKGNVQFLKDSIVPFFEQLTLWNTKAKVVLPSAALLFEFNEKAQPNIEAVSLNCLEIFAESNKFYIKNSKSDGNGFKIKSVYRNKKDERSLLFIAKGTVVNTETKTMEQNQLYLTYKWKYYSN